MSEFSVNLPPRLPAASAAASVMTAIVPDPPRHLTQLDNGTILKGTVQGRDNEGLLVVSTDKGILKLSTPANLAPGSQVLLEVRATGDRLQVLVLSVEPGAAQGSGQPAAPGAGQVPPRGTGTAAPAPSGSSGSAAPPPRPAAPAVPVAIVGSVLQGTVVQAPPETLTQLFRALLPNPPQAIPPAPLPPGPGPATAQPFAQPPAQPGTAIISGAATSGPAATAGAPTGANTTPGLAPAAVPAPQAAAEAPAPSVPTAAIPNAAGQPAPVPAPAATPPRLGSTLQSEVQAKIESLFVGANAGSAASLPATGAPLQPPATPAGQSLAESLKLLAALPTGTEVKLRLIAISPGPGQPVVLPTPTAGAPHVMAGRIIGYTPTGHAVLHSPLGAIVLHGSLAVPVGTELSFAIEPAIPTLAAAAMAAPTLPQFLLSLSRGWPSLFETLALLRQASPGAGATSGPVAPLQNLPQPGSKLAAGMVAAMQALRSGNIEALLGGLGTLRGGGAEREETVRKLRQEFGQISSLAQDKPGADWRCFFIPLYDDGAVRQINLFYRRDRGKARKGEEAGGSGTRFIVEVDMSKMGPFQFDGLVREKRFDLMVRSHVALPPKMREDIGALFQEALAIGDYAGNLQFQKVKDFPVSPLEEIEKSAARVSA